MKIALFGNSHQTEKSSSARKLLDALERQGAEIWMCEKFYRFLTEKVHLHPSVAGLIRGNDFHADIALSIGGDGTFLKTAERVGNKGIPILGINTGRLGFLADVPENEIEETIGELFTGDYLTEERSLLQVSAAGLSPDFTPVALNEVAVSKRDSSSMISIQTWLNDDFLNTYQADGLIISTPTGSTAYSLSVGGPVIVPQARNFVITAVAPHSLNIRPLVINDDVTVRLKVESRSGNFLISLDGRSLDLPAGTILTIRKAAFNLKVIKRRHHLFYDTLRHKLMWGADKRIEPHP